MNIKKVINEYICLKKKNKRIKKKIKAYRIDKLKIIK